MNYRVFHNRIVITISFFFLLPLSSSAVTILNSKAEVLAIITKVNDYWQNSNTYQTSSFWDRAAYQTGNMEAYSVTGNELYRTYAENWAKYNNWIGATGTNKSRWKYTYGEGGDYVLFGDNQICFQTYIDLYNLSPDPVKIARATEVMGYEIASTHTDYWWWADGLYMVMPVMTKMYKLTGNQLYLDKLYEYFCYADSVMYDNAESLYYRDGTYVYPAHTTLSGKKDFWARGDGWVFAALAKVLKDLPLTDIHRPFYETRFRNMAAALIKIQQPEGYWTRSLLDPAQAEGRETSGTAFFTYGLLWGINNGYLDKATYLPAAALGWSYLSTIALQPNGSVGYVQPIGSAAVPGQSVTATNTANFGVGAFLLAASELTRLPDITSGTNSIIQDSKYLRVYPNPSFANLTVESTAEIKGEIELFDLVGNLLKSKTGNGQKSVVDLTSFCPGIYILKVNNETIKVIKN
jgi:unsaturated rhamnogalacturonyl hydrolase